MEQTTERYIRRKPKQRRSLFRNFSKHDLEKWFFNLLFATGAIAILYRYLRGFESDATIVNFVLGLGALTVTRKGLSYFKSDAYYANEQLVNGQPSVQNAARAISVEAYNKGA